jgi:hypothetical protein
MSKIYLRREQIAARYGGIRARTVERYVKTGKLPPPLYINGSRTPLWPVDVLEEFERLNMCPGASRCRRPKPMRPTMMLDSRIPAPVWCPCHSPTLGRSAQGCVVIRAALLEWRST